MSIKTLRLKRGMTQKELAEKIPGFDRGRIADYETGRRSVSNMTLGKALAICDALHVSNPRKLLDDDIE
ncbi:helix-turn-helix domain-containing protein [Bifidobacterium tsurumiense]|uniref:helix-turn-helix domain-containing protein n=1 Tax=Bifidobacterium tsurumiense TaxID=356829 RepID=UPI0004796912|nr:helix-turn-helix transcriptional regulator [Bifidobacterium tsurumiense]MDY4678451.1 helix-turn-helix transcriptional regulator [Bifidobacterium tsurumiense]MSS12055.1 helix-turn-helix transcriptional regulator [Bifidobacterium tsurumiense]